MTRLWTTLGLFPKARGTIFKPVAAFTLMKLRFQFALLPLAVLRAAAMDVLPEPIGHLAAFPFGDGLCHG